MLKIMLVNSVFGTGSTGKIVEDLFDRYVEYGYDACFAYGRKCNINKKKELYGYRIGNEGSFYCHAVKSRIFDMHGLASTHATKNFIKYIRSFNPDVIHLHNIHGYYLNYKVLFEYLNSTSIKLIWTLHDAWTITGHCAYFGMCEKWKTMCRNCSHIRSYPASLFFDKSKMQFIQKKELFTKNSNMQLVSPSNWLAGIIRQSYLKEQPVTVINNGINLENFKPTDNHTFDNVVDRSKKILLGVASPFSKRKGFSDFLKLAQIIDKERYQIVLVGVSDEQIQKLPDGVIGIKRTDNQSQLAELYSMAYAFLNFTYEDNFPTVNIEALACGTPVICYKTGGATEMLDEKNSIILERGEYYNVPYLIEKVAMLKLNTEQDIVNIEKKYSAKAMSNKYIELIERLYTKE